MRVCVCDVRMCWSEVPLPPALSPTSPSIVSNASGASTTRSTHPCRVRGFAEHGGVRSSSATFFLLTKTVRVKQL